MVKSEVFLYVCAMHYCKLCSLGVNVVLPNVMLEVGGLFLNIF